MNQRSAQHLDHSQGVWVVEYARQVVEDAVREDHTPEPADAVDPVFEVNRGAFVTLEKAGELRGCIGRPTAEQPAIEAIHAAAIGAATEDPRFPPVAESELDPLTVEVSVLTPPEPIEAPDPSAIEVGRDGLIVGRNGNRGLLLPQVAVDQGWDAKTFLEQTCRKAGLPADCWRDEATRLERFGAQIFEEREPSGEIEAVEISARE
ncbi:MAG: AmmeMemoRadiSam system protein A [Halobacteriota archaeon]